MTKKVEKPEGNPKEAFELAKDLLKTLQNSELMKNGKDNPVLSFDVMMAIASFTSLILKTMKTSFAHGDMLVTIYMKHILPDMLEDSDIDTELKSLKEAVMANQSIMN